jgi:ATP-dependent helicase/nuclease subunit A
MTDTSAVQRPLTLPEWLPEPLSMAVTAGAGTGKTTALVERYLLLIERQIDAYLSDPVNSRKPSLSRGVAITFTRKAAREMRDRVRQQLQTRRHVDDPTRRTLWNDLLNEIDAARIQTIDALQGDILRANAAAAGVSPRFKMLDDMAGRVLLSDAITDALQTASTDPDHAAMPVIRAYEAYAIREALKNSSLIATEIPAISGDLMTQWREAWWDAAQQWRKETFAANSDVHTILHERVDNPKFEAYHLEFRVSLQAVLDADNAESFRVALARISALARQGSLGGDSAKTLRGAIKAVQEACRNDFKLPYPEDSPDGQIAELIPAWIALISLTREKLADMKRRQNVLDFADIASLAHQILTQNPEVAARYQPPNGEYDFVLVDEFQDTDQRQWETILALAPLDVPGALFIVGDAKQSIYNFRGADVRVFEVARRAIKQTGKSVALRVSYRTHSQLIDKFNVLFEKFMRPPASGVQDAAVYASHDPLEALADAKHPDPTRSTITAILSEGENSQEKLEREAAGLAARIVEMVTDGWLVRDRESRSTRSVRYGDFAILLRSLSHVDVFEQAFSALDIPYLTLGSRTYFNRREIGDLIALLSALDIPDDDLNLAAALHSPLFGLSDVALLALRRRPESVLWQQLMAEAEDPGDSFPEEERPTLHFAATLLTDLRRRAGRQSISQILLEIVERTGIMATLSPLPNGAQARVNIDKLIALAHTAGYVTVPAFARFAQEMRAGNLRESDAVLDAEGRVQLMTIHAAKGLEFAVVCLANAHSPGGGRDGTLIEANGRIACMLPSHDLVKSGDDKTMHGFAWASVKAIRTERETAEAQRLLYVALTRARDYLIVSGAALSDKQRETSGTWLAAVLNSEQVDEEVTVSEGGLADPGLIEHASDLSPAWLEHPALLDRIEMQAHDLNRHIAATTLAHLGGARTASLPGARALARQRARKSLAGDQRGPLHRVGDGQTNRSRLVGELVHEALQYGYDTLAPDAREPLLRGLVWNLGLTDSAAQDAVLEQCDYLLRKIDRLPLTREIRHASTVLREVPFVLTREAQIIHGVIDLLFRNANGQWVLVDYKTDFIPQELMNHLEVPAANYHLQLALYAEAALERLGVMPRVMVCFIRQGVVELSPEILGAALKDTLLPQIRDVLSNETPL